MTPLDDRVRRLEELMLQHDERISRLDTAIFQIADHTARVTAMLEIVIQLLQQRGDNDAENGR